MFAASPRLAGSGIPRLICRPVENGPGTTPRVGRSRVIREGLAGKRILMTGATGFLGTALFERLLTDVPVERIDLLIRRDAPARLRTMLSGSAFRPAAERLGGGEAPREPAAANGRAPPADPPHGPVPPRPRGGLV